ncbi:MAG: hypothetical protein H6P95_894 [Candidatus Aminicenantes bacterium]|jgi:hypothetical protein|nr:hypothetical protein [Candidatus Aminicenantes bacterium]
MPARSDRITVVPDRNGQPVRVLRFPAWWDRAAFIERFSDRELDTGNPIDWNLAWLLSAAEAAAWDDLCRAGLPKDPRGVDPLLLEEMGQLAALLRQGGWVIVESHEWESGLD